MTNNAVALPGDDGIVPALQGWFASNPGATVVAATVLPSGMVLVIYTL